MSSTFGVAISMSLSAFQVEKVYQEDGSLSIPNYPILDKRALSESRGGEVQDFSSARDGLGVMITPYLDN